MEQKVIDYFDSYFGGQLNESTTDEQLELAALDLIFLTEAVIEFYESIAGAAHELGHITHMQTHLKRPFLGLGWTKAARERNRKRKQVGQTIAGTAELAKLDRHKAVQSAQKRLDHEINKNPEVMHKDPDVAKKAKAAGKEKAKDDFEKHMMFGHKAKKQRIDDGGSPRGSAHRRFFGAPFGTERITSEEIKYYEDEEEETQKTAKKKKKDRDVLPSGAEFVASRNRAEVKARKDDKDYERAGTSGRQGSLMVDAGKLMTRARRITGKSGREVEAETKRASEQSGSIYDILKKLDKKQLNKVQNSRTRREREARGQGRLF